MMTFLAIDQSTSATKALIFSADGSVLAKASVDHRQIYPKPGWVEHDAEEIWQNTLNVIQTVTTEYPTPARMSISNQRETIVVFDRKTGKPLHNAIVWQCRRGDAICTQMKADNYETDVRFQTGLMIDTYFSASKVRWLVENNPSIRTALSNGTAIVGTIDTYLIYRLTKGKVFATDHSNACRTLLYDIRKLAWSDSLCELFQVPKNALAEIRDSNGDFGTTDAEGVLSCPIRIRGVMGDSQASLFAMGCYQIGETKVTFGTGSSLLLNVGNEIPTLDSGSVATVAWVINGQPTYGIEGIINYSAATVQWLRDQLKLINNADETQAIAESVENNAGVYLVPAFAGLSAPYWSSDARAAIVGMTAHSSRAHVVRAALESISYQVRDVLDMMRRQSGVAIRLIHADGGATANAFLMQFTADIIDTEVQTTRVAESSPLGAMMCGSIGSELASMDQLKRPFAGHCYQRTMSKSEADKNYDGWRRAVARVL